MPGAHARLSPSAAHRWLRCPGSVNLCAQYEDEATEYAAEGTAAHKVADACLMRDKDVRDYLGRKVKADGYSFEVTEEWVDWLQPGIDRIRDLGGEFYGEQKVKLDRWMPGQFGTLDRGIVRRKSIVVGDLKFGAGVPVSPVENEQLMIYALGFWDRIARKLTKARKIHFIIDQPRCPGGGGEWSTSLSELREFGEHLKERAALTYEEDAPLVAGPTQCRFCPAANDCPAFQKFNMDLIGSKFEDLDRAERTGAAIRPKSAEKLTPERRSVIVRSAPMIRKWLDGLHADTLADAVAGRPTPDLKAVEGRKGARKWKNEDLAERRLRRMLGDDAYETKLITPTEAERRAGKDGYKKLEKFTEQSDPKPVLVPVEDGRKSVKTTASKFKNLDEENETYE